MLTFGKNHDILTASSQEACRDVCGMGILRKFISRQNPNGNSSAPPIGRGLVCVRVFDAPLRIFASAFFPYERKDAVRRLFEYQANSCRGLSESAEVRSLSEFPEEEEV